VGWCWFRLRSCGHRRRVSPGTATRPRYLSPRSITKRDIGQLVAAVTLQEDTATSRAREVEEETERMQMYGISRSADGPRSSSAFHARSPTVKSGYARDYREKSRRARLAGITSCVNRFGQHSPSPTILEIPRSVSLSVGRFDALNLIFAANGIERRISADRAIVPRRPSACIDVQVSSACQQPLLRDG
jgi:hypothetical protein